MAKERILLLRIDGIRHPVFRHFLELLFNPRRCRTSLEHAIASPERITKISYKVSRIIDTNL